jgi:DsbC/DsbD-like thiol-disulfide interchange protein
MGGTSTRCVIGLALLALLALLLGKSGTAMAQAKKSDAVVKVEAKADDKPDANGKQTITITLDVEKGWHVYANPVENEDLASVQTSISIASKAQLEDVKIEYPVGKEYGKGDEKHKIYEGKVTIKARVKRARGDDGPLEVAIKLQACNSSTCLFPATIKTEARCDR